MDRSNSIKNTFQWKTYLLKSDLDSIFSNQLTVFLQRFEKEWATHFNDVSYDLCQLESGNRLRPIVAFLGYLISETECPLTDDDFDKIVRVGVCVELIHKSSLIIDDMIDDDSLRSGKTTFHIANGQEKAVIVSFHLISKAYKLLMEAISESNISESMALRCVNMSINIINDMSAGLLRELSMDKTDFSNLKLAKEIILNETGSIIKNSFLIGYVFRGGTNRSIIKCLDEIGDSCGYMFQIMNDIEPYKNGAQYKTHKGKDKLEFFYNRKNIITTFMLQLMDAKEKEQFYLISDGIEGNTKLFKYFNERQVYDHFISEIEEIKKNIENLIERINKEGIDIRWCLNCKDFIKSLTEVAFSRLS